MSILKKIRQFGFVYSLAIAFQRIVPVWLFRARYYVVLRLDTDYQPVVRENPVQVQIETNEAKIQTVEKLTYFERASSAGTATACSARIDDRLVGGFWAAQQSFDESELGVRVKLAPEQCWLFAALVEKSARGFGSYSQLIKCISDEMAATGVNDQLVAVNPFNKPSYKVLHRFAGEPIARVLAIRFLNQAVCFRSGQVKSDKTFSMDCSDSPIVIESERQPLRREEVNAAVEQVESKRDFAVHQLNH